jgi:hypothetical protein
MPPDLQKVTSASVCPVTDIPQTTGERKQKTARRQSLYGSCSIDLSVLPFGTTRRATTMRRCGLMRRREGRRLGFFDGFGVSSGYYDVIAAVLIS